MNEIFQQLVNGLALGAVYALIAIGYTMVYGVLRFINFAHGDVFMLGSFTGYYLAPQIAKWFPLPGWGGWVVVMAATWSLPRADRLVATTDLICVVESATS